MKKILLMVMFSFANLWSMDPNNNNNNSITKQVHSSYFLVEIFNDMDKDVGLYSYILQKTDQDGLEIKKHKHLLEKQKGFLPGANYTDADCIITLNAKAKREQIYLLHKQTTDSLSNQEGISLPCTLIRQPDQKGFLFFKKCDQKCSHPPAFRLSLNRILNASETDSSLLLSKEELAKLEKTISVKQ